MTRSEEQRRNIRATVFALLGVMTLIVALFVRQFVNPAHLDPEWLRVHGAVLFDSPRVIDAPRLLDQEAQAFDGHGFSGHWSVLFFGYTFCPDVCPTTLSLLRNVERDLGSAQGDGSTIGFYMVSVDPARDTPAVLKAYTSHFSPRFHGLTGEFLDVHRFATQLNVPFLKVSNPDGSYGVDHGANLVLLDPQGRYAGYVRPPLDAKLLAELLSVLRKRG